METAFPFGLFMLPYMVSLQLNLAFELPDLASLIAHLGSNTKQGLQKSKLHYGLRPAEAVLIARPLSQIS